MPRAVYEIKYDAEFFDNIIKGFLYSAPRTFTEVDLVKRWLVFGLCREMAGVKSFEQCEAMINAFVTVIKK